ncbi:MAG: hypothetical protein KKF44_10845 [Nanoarchaeota archaeon]|nr:hypothetical protein [Nanoarchaeota archaeon]
MKNDVMRFIVNGLMFIAVLIIAVVPIELKIQKDLHEMLKLDQLASEDLDIVFFGDSVMHNYAANDTDKRSMAELLENYSKRDVLQISQGASHLGIFEAYSEFICRMEKKPSLVIVPINLRSFSAEWDLRPQYQSKKEIEAIRSSSLSMQFINRIKKVFSEDSSKMDTWKHTPVYLNSTQRGFVKDYLFKPSSIEDIKSKYVFHYLYGLDKDHRKLDDLRNLIDNYQNCGVPLIVYITPIDHEMGDFYVGEEFSQIVRNNVETIKSIENTHDIKIQDFTFDLDKTFFDHPETPNEHLNEKGRIYVVKYLLVQILKEKT